MSLSPLKRFAFSVLIPLALVSLGCGKKTAAAPPPPPPAPVTPAAPAPAPTITLRAEPSTIDRGTATTLQWEARNAAMVTITPGLGDVAVTGNRSVNPTSSVTYTASASGPGGTASDTARVTVNVPAAPPETPGSRRGPDVSTDALSFDRNIQDVTFDYDKADIRPDQVSVLQKNAAWLKANATVGFTVEGHCDERGSEEYNLGLGDRRANAVKEFLIAQGIQANRISTVSYGEERPACREQTEDCYTRNRRAHFAVTR
jgi:peptidoglycan-associated lipoprotein